MYMYVHHCELMFTYLTKLINFSWLVLAYNYHLYMYIH